MLIVFALNYHKYSDHQKQNVLMAFGRVKITGYVEKKLAGITKMLEILVLMEMRLRLVILVTYLNIFGDIYLQHLEHNIYHNQHRKYNI